MSKRLRDPVHGLIVFDDFNQIGVDDLAWSLIDTPEFQRLRRIKQLGVSEFTFPGAVHNRFTHSVGVFHTARALIVVINREMLRHKRALDIHKSQTAVVAALLHDLGHGPFSHTFEGIQATRGSNKRHEQWTAEIIRNTKGRIFPLLEKFRDGFADHVAALLEKEDPEDIYHAVVSSSFDADRLDYLRRDKLMTGSGAGGIDFDWLIENIRIAEIEIDAPDPASASNRMAPTFCLEKKALPAAEQFLLARYTLHQQVYFHKATRCVEHMIASLITSISALAARKKDWAKTGLDSKHPLLAFFRNGGETVDNYLKLDDTLIFGSLHALSQANDLNISSIARRLLSRELYKTLDLADFGEDKGAQASKLRRIRKKFDSSIKTGDVLIDDKAAIGIYSEIGGDEEKLHKKIHILDGGKPKEISALSPLVMALVQKKQFTRIYFKNLEDRDDAKNL